MRFDGDFQETKGFDFRIIENLFLTPKLGDPDKQRTALMIHRLSTIVLLICISTLLFSPIIFDDYVIGFLFIGTVTSAMVIVQLLNKNGKIRAAAHIFVYFIWVVDTILILISDGSHSEYLPAYIAVTIMGGLILGGPSVFHLAGLSLLSYSIFYVLDVQGLMLDPLIIFNPLMSFIQFSINLFMSVLVLILVLKKYEDTFSQLIDNEQSLFRTNLELKWEIQAWEQAEVYYKHSEDRFKSAIMKSPYPTMLHTADGEILFINTAWEEMTGYKTDEYDYIDELYNQIFRDSSYQVSVELNKLTDGELIQSEGSYQIFTKKGLIKNWYLRWVVLPGFQDGRSNIMTIALDMTNLIDVETALRKSEEDLSKLSLITNDGIWDWDLRTDRVIFDSRYYTMAGYEVDEFPYHLDEFRKRVHLDDVEYVLKQAAEHLDGNEDSFNVEFRFLKKDNSWMWVLGRGKIIEQDEFGNPIRFVGTHTDISDRKRIEEDLSKYRQQLEQQVVDRTKKIEDRIKEVEKLNAALFNILDDYQIANEKLSRISSNLTNTNRELESFTYVVSNDLKYPLQSIMDISEELTKSISVQKDKKLLEFLNQINHKADQMERLVTDLIYLSEIGKVDLDIQVVNPSELVKNVVRSFDDEIKERNITLNIKELPLCQADPDLLINVYENLISNAIKFTQEKKKPEIIIGSQPDDSNERVIYFIKDNGIGFNMKDHERFFDTFHRLHDQDIFRGAGIGLTLAQKVINQHDGKLWAEAKKGQGATFYFDLKRVNKPN